MCQFKTSALMYNNVRIVQGSFRNAECYTLNEQCQIELSEQFIILPIYFTVSLINGYPIYKRIFAGTNSWLSKISTVTIRKKKWLYNGANEFQVIRVNDATKPSHMPPVLETLFHCLKTGSWRRRIRFCNNSTSQIPCIILICSSLHQLMP